MLVFQKEQIIPYDHNLIEKARKLRKNSTFSERLMWRYLRNRQFQGLDFDRQKPIDKFIVDFYCSDLRLVIEVDGITHNDKLVEDLKRQKRLEALGLSVLRYNALEVINNMQGVLEDVRCWILENRKPSPILSQEGY